MFPPEVEARPECCPPPPRLPPRLLPAAFPSASHLTLQGHHFPNNSTTKSSCFPEITQVIGFLMPIIMMCCVLTLCGACSNVWQTHRSAPSPTLPCFSNGGIITCYPLANGCPNTCRWTSGEGLSGHRHARSLMPLTARHASCLPGRRLGLPAAALRLRMAAQATSLVGKLQ